MRKLYVVGGCDNYANWMQGQIVKNIEDADLVVFTGGEDVDPSLYNRRPHRTTGSNINRDIYEKKYFDIATELHKAIIGICRGSQFACVMNGGILVQHQQNPAYIHKIKTDNGEFEITSTHHQAAFPFVLPKDEYKILGWTNGISDFHFGEDNEELNPKPECEIVFYPKTRCLGIQGHPEHSDMMNTDYRRKTIDFLRGLIKTYLNV